MFCAKVTRDLMNEMGDVGADLRTTMKAMVLIDIVPEEYSDLMTSLNLTRNLLPSAMQ